MSIYDSNDIQGTGTGLQPAIAQAYPELRVLMQQFFSSRVSKCAWLPDDWLTTVRDIQASTPDDLVMIRRKDWGDPDATAAWRALADDSSQIVAQYAAKQAEIGRALLQQIADDSDFWSTAYKVAVKTAADIAGGIKEGVDDVRKVGKNLTLIITVVGVAVALFFLSPYIPATSKLFRK